MPTHSYTLLGKPLSRFTPRISKQFLSGVALLAVLTLIFTLPSRVTPNRTLSEFKDDHHLTLPKFAGKLPSASKFNPFAPTAHAPPVQANSTNGDSKWYGSLSWLSPYSSSITMDEDRAVLPPLIERPPIYTYYDAGLEKDKEIKSAHNGILLTWRRAWWAKGFRPVVLGPLEAKKSSIYQELETLNVKPELSFEISRWLAWEHMNGGILCCYLTLPMGSFDDPVLSHLRRPNNKKPVRFESLGNGLYVGSKSDITAAIQAAITSHNLKTGQYFHDLTTPDTFQVETPPASIAHYTQEVVQSKYKVVDEELQISKAKGFASLNELMNAHLHDTWQELFSNGIVVLKPIKKYMTAILEPAAHVSALLAQCSDSPMLSSCPPNNPKCKPCVASHPLKTSTFPHFKNTSNTYTIGVVPHPWTTASMESQMSDMSIRYIRRETERNTWLRTITQLNMGNGVSTLPRLVKVKEAVASPHGMGHSVWFTAERQIPSDLEWHFGFALPKNVTMRDNKAIPEKNQQGNPVPGKSPLTNQVLKWC